VDALLAKTSIGISELREAPARVFEQAGDEALVVLNHNKPAGYIVSTVWMGRVLDALADRVVADKAIKRLGTLKSARLLNPSDL
jgi:antitoxin StbD